MDFAQLLTPLSVCVLVCPAVLFAVLGLSALAGYRLAESTIVSLTRTAVVLGLTAATIILALMLTLGTRHVELELGNWVVIPQEHFHFTLKVVFDRLSVPFVMLSFALCSTIGVFARSYMHREPGFHRFFVLYALFLLGMIVTSVAGTIEMLFAGWELVGLSSALLVAFFHDRPAPVRNGQRTWLVYRVADAAFLIAAVAMHHLSGEGDLSGMMGAGPWPEGQASLTSWQALWVGGLLLVAAAGKSALLPFSGWLPRAMEGPTPSSAIFYGALSVHLGAFLLLRVSPILELSPPLCAAVAALGVATAVYASLSARAQTDIKSALAFGSLTQVGLIVAEIGLGFRYVALIHILGHACLRTLQLVRAPSLMHDYSTLEDAIGARLDHGSSRAARWLPDALRQRLYRMALHRGDTDAVLNACLVQPVLALFRACDRWERRWTDLLSGRPSRESDRVPQTLEAIDPLS